MQNDSGSLLIFCIQEQALAEKNGGVKTACKPHQHHQWPTKSCAALEIQTVLAQCILSKWTSTEKVLPRWIRKFTVISINSPWREHLLSSGHRYETQSYPVYKELKLQRSTCFTNVKLRFVCDSWSNLSQSMVRISLNFHITEEIMPLNYCCKLSFSLYSPLSETGIRN